MKLQKQSVFLLTVAVIIVLYVPFAIHINNTDINIDKGSVGTTTITTVTVSMTPSKSITTSKTTDNKSTTTRKTTKQSKTSAVTTIKTTTVKTSKPSHTITTTAPKTTKPVTTTQQELKPVNINTATANEISDCLLIDIDLAEKILI